MEQDLENKVEFKEKAKVFFDKNKKKNSNIFNYTIFIFVCIIFN